MCEFLSKFIYAISSLDFNVIGLLCGFIGGLLITFFGLPSIGVLNEGMYVEVTVTSRMRMYRWLARLGLILVMVGFLFQLVPAVKLIPLP
jgi:hypothetical protein